MADPAAAPPRDAGIKGEVRLQDPDRSQRAIARRSAEARATIPDLELSCEVDPAPSLLAAGAASLPTAILVRACALALRTCPRANGAYRDGRFELYSRINVGVTLAAADSYAIPTLFDCDLKSVEELGQELSQLTARAQAGALSQPELTGATFTISNVGSLGITSATPVIVPPQAAGICAGAVRELPVLRDGAIVPGRKMTLTLACDHRILYGARAAEFLAAVRSRLQEDSL